jgi:hypothetical protein
MTVIYFLNNFNPSLFQNVILGLLALLVPIGVGILSYFFKEKSEKNIAANLEVFILIDKVLCGDRIVVYSFFVLFLLAVSEASLFLKIYAIISFVFYITWLFFVPFKNIWKWFFVATKDFAVSFLKGLDVKKDGNTMIDSWRALWLGDGISDNERNFTSIFISHIDDALKHGKLNLAIQLSQTYVSNINKREYFSVGFEILPKILEWNELLWNKEQSWLRTYDWEKKIRKIFPEKHFPTFQKVVLHVFKKIYKIDDSFWNWNYFDQEFFKNVIIILLNNNHYQLFTHFKKHIDECENKLKKIEAEKDRQKYWYYITGVFKVFCTTFFNNINKAQSKYSIWEQDFPGEWKITSLNLQNNPSRIIFGEFLSWSQDRVFKKDKENEYDDDLTEVMNGLFPNVHPAYFPDFLMLFFSYSVKDALDKQPNFFIMGSSISWSGEKSDDEISEMFKQNEISRKEETIDIILKYFGDWKHIKIFKEDLADDENKKWKEFPKEERNKIIKRVRINKLNKLKEELDSEEIKKYCEAVEIKDITRKEFLTLVSLLIDKVSEK